MCGKASGGRELQHRWDLSHTSVLVIEDNGHMRSILRSVLSGIGVRQIYEATDGGDGLEIVLERMPDFILCDWAMKPVNGAEFIRTLRADSDAALNTIPVLVVSAHASRAAIIQAVQLGIHGYIAKPFSPAILYDRISDILEKQAMNGRSKGMFELKNLVLPKATQPEPVSDRAETTEVLIS